MNKIITISRQYGSGGREIGQKLAKHYDIPFYDNEIITRAAKESGFAEETFAGAEDKQFALFTCYGYKCLWKPGFWFQWFVA